MQRFKFWLMRKGGYRVARPFVKNMAKLVGFVQFADWIHGHGKVDYNDFPTKKDYTLRFGLFDYVLKRLGGQPINYMEFGVFDGETFHRWMQQQSHPDSRFYGFDTFDGLPEEWSGNAVGAFTQHGRVPALRDSRGRFIQGFFQDTFGPFLKTFEDNRPKVILLDADLYSSTLFVLTSLAPLLRKGDILIFDEFSSKLHEFRAYNDFLKAYTWLSPKLIAAANNYTCAAFEV
jgi:O-methyltransferase